MYVHSTANYSGLFGYCAASDSKTPVIKNLSVDNSSIIVPYIYSTGGIVGYIGNGTIIYSPLSYAYSVLSAYPNDDGVHDNARNLVKSLYQYNKKAVAYKTV